MPGDLESQTAVPAKTSANFDGVCSSLATQLYELSSKVNSINKLISRQKALGARGTTGDFDERIIGLAEETTELFKSAKKDVQLVAEWESQVLVAKQRLAQDRLNREFSALLTLFRGQQRDIAELQRSSLVASKTAQIVEEEEQRRRQSESTPLLAGGGESRGYLQEENDGQLQQQQILDMVRQEDVDFQTSLIQERELEIQGIQEGISEINAIFRDLGTLVTQQGDEIDTFENNISNLSTNTKQAGDELVAANEYQRKRRNCSFCVLVVLIIVLLVIVLAVTVS